MKARLIFWLAIAMVALSTLGYFVLRKPSRTTAMVWHWLHGDSVRVGKYAVPVPPEWFPKSALAEQAFLIDTRTEGHSSWPGTNVITVIYGTPQLYRAEGWKSYIRQWLTDHGVNSIEERTLSFGDENITCLGGDELTPLIHPATAAKGVISIECSSSSGSLSLSFLGQQQGLQDLYSLIPNIKKLK